MDEVMCNWCGEQVAAFLSHYILGKFYHQSCFKERQAK